MTLIRKSFKVDWRWRWEQMDWVKSGKWKMFGRFMFSNLRTCRIFFSEKGKSNLEVDCHCYTKTAYITFVHFIQKYIRGHSFHFCHKVYKKNLFLFIDPTLFAPPQPFYFFIFLPRRRRFSWTTPTQIVIAELR